jgi:hypothetical protein
VTLGGPIRKDKLWFFASFREWGNQHVMAGNFWNKTQGTPFYTPDLSQPCDSGAVVRIESGAGHMAGRAEAQVQLLRRRRG